MLACRARYSQVLVILTKMAAAIHSTLVHAPDSDTAESFRKSQFKQCVHLQKAFNISVCQGNLQYWHCKG